MDTIKSSGYSLESSTTFLKNSKVTHDIVNWYMIISMWSNKDKSGIKFFGVPSQQWILLEYWSFHNLDWINIELMLLTRKA